MDGLSYEPLKFYKNFAKEKHKSYTEEHFEELVKSSGMNPEENRATVKKYEEELERIKKIASTVRILKVFFWLTLIVGIIGALCLAIGYALYSGGGDHGWAYMAGGAALSLLVFILSFIIIRPKIKKSEKLRASYQKNAEALYSEALAQMAPLNALFDDLEYLPSYFEYL